MTQVWADKPGRDGMVLPGSSLIGFYLAHSQSVLNKGQTEWYSPSAMGI